MLSSRYGSIFFSYFLYSLVFFFYSSQVNTVSETNVKFGVSLLSFLKFVVLLVSFSSLTIKIPSVSSREMLSSDDWFVLVCLMRAACVSIMCWL